MYNTVILKSPAMCAEVALKSFFTSSRCLGGKLIDWLKDNKIHSAFIPIWQMMKFGRLVQ